MKRIALLTIIAAFVLSSCDAPVNYYDVEYLDGTRETIAIEGRESPRLDRFDAFYFFDVEGRTVVLDDQNRIIKDSIRTWKRIDDASSASIPDGIPILTGDGKSSYYPAYDNQTKKKGSSTIIFMPMSTR